MPLEKAWKTHNCFLLLHGHPVNYSHLLGGLIRV